MRWAFLMICCAVLRIRPVRNVHSGRVQLGRARFGLTLTSSQKSSKREWRGEGVSVVSNFNLMSLDNLIFLNENAGVEFDINDGVIVDSGTKKDSPAGE